jgi:hypothetical protein
VVWACWTLATAPGAGRDVLYSAVSSRGDCCPQGATCAYLRRCYVAPVLYRTAAGRCGTILGAVNDEASTNLAACSGVTVRASCRPQAGWATSAGLDPLSFRYRPARDVIGAFAPHLARHRERRLLLIANGPRRFQPFSCASLARPREGAGACFFPACAAGGVRDSLASPRSQPGVGGGSVGRKQRSQSLSRSALLPQIRGAPLISVGLVGPTACVASITRTMSAGPQY